jgi:hypothetical protein
VIAGIPVKELTAPVLCGIFVLLVFVGYLIPRRIYKDKAEESERWRTAFETERTARQTSDDQTSELLEGQKTTHAVILAVLKNSDLLLKAGGQDVAS